jgi:hypothetical protein
MAIFYRDHCLYRIVGDALAAQKSAMHCARVTSVFSLQRLKSTDAVIRDPTRCGGRALSAQCEASFLALFKQLM